MMMVNDGPKPYKRLNRGLGIACAVSICALAIGRLYFAATISLLRSAAVSNAVRKLKVRSGCTACSGLEFTSGAYGDAALLCEGVEVGGVTGGGGAACDCGATEHCARTDRLSAVRFNACNFQAKLKPGLLFLYLQMIIFGLRYL